MGLIAGIKEFTRAVRRGAKVNDIKLDTGGGFIRTGEMFGPVGDDAQPLPTDQPILIRSVGSGRYAVIGFLDPINAGETEPGERRIYSRSSAGAVTGYVWFKTDGTVGINGLINHAVQYEALLSAFNELRGELNAFMSVFDSHIHATTATVGASATVGIISATETPGTAAAADMSGARVASVRVP